MNIFNVHNQVIEEYSKYISSFLDISNTRIKEAVEEYFKSRKLWPQPLLQFNPSYELSEPIDHLCKRKILHDKLNHVFKDLTLFKHQIEALELGSKKENFIVTSGTGSGKSLTFLGSIFHHLFSNPERPKGISAIIVYPMNALINSQYLEIEKFQTKYEQSSGEPFGISYKKYTGQESNEEKEQVIRDNPDILLTNYMMLELIMTRLGESSLKKSIEDNLHFLVFDELHTYRGRQGSDVSMLIRRIHSQCKNKVVTIGTSATMVSGNSALEQKQKVAEVAQKIFGQPFSPEQIIREKLVRSVNSEGVNIDPRLLAHELKTGYNGDTTRVELHSMLLGKWLENEIALETIDGELSRRRPLMWNQIVDKLKDTTSLEYSICDARLKEFLIRINEENNKDPKPEPAVLPFKLHQFISQTGTVYVTLEKPDERAIRLDPAVVLVDDNGDRKPLFPLVFSRISGAEFICVNKDISLQKFQPREFNQRIAEEDEDNLESGYIIFDDGEPVWDDSQIDNLPDTWFNYKKNGDREIKKEYRDKIPAHISFDVSGQFSENINEYDNTGWFMPAPLLFDPTSGTFYDRRTSEGTKLSKLGTEGRSTATTVLSYSTVKSLADEKVDYTKQKLLSFTDNRQDASLQAGHFNDFYRVGRLRSAVYKALKLSENRTLDHTTIVENVFEALGLKQEQYAKSPSDLPFQREENENALKTHLEYRLLFDLKKGWRVTLPNLEQCGLLLIDYKHLMETCKVESFWQPVVLLGEMTLEERYDFLLQILDYFRKNYALTYSKLEVGKIRENTKAIREEIKPEWGLDENEEIEIPVSLRVEPQIAFIPNLYTESIGIQSYFGKYIKSVAKERNIKFDKQSYNDFVHLLLDKLAQAKYISVSEIKSDKLNQKVYRLEVKTILWKCGDGRTIQPDKIRLRSYRDNKPVINKYFRDFYQQDFTQLKTIEAREHTAQIKNEERQDREAKFRKGDISVLSCSPTMELGIDIASLNIVHMRNVPPSPANYAQRSGRAGRSGQAALVLTFCSTFAPHDRHYFNRPDEMVAGVVRPSKIDLFNEELIRTHLHAIYLAEAGVSELDHSVGDLLDLDNIDELKLRPKIVNNLKFSARSKDAVRQAFRKVIEGIEPDLKKTYWYKDDWISKTIDEVPQQFDLALDRWRDLFRAAERQLIQAQEIIKNPYYSNTSEEKKNAYKSERNANQQKDQLLNNDKLSSRSYSEFYPYRYLAAEGFLPGYNFTRLPIRAFIQIGETGEYISRPRFLALREFGPNNVIYHNGARYKINQIVQQEMDKKLHNIKISKSTGYALMGEEYDLEFCPFSNEHLKTDNDKHVFTSVLELSENKTYRIDRITCEEEERLTMGYDIKTFFSIEGPKERTETVVVKDGRNQLLKLVYIPAATLIKLNAKWKVRRELGFLLNIKTGFWKTEADLRRTEGFSDIKRVLLSTKDTVDAIYIYPLEALALKPGSEEESIITFQFALKRAIENIYQIEQNEIGVEIMGEKEVTNIMIYEASEGSLGILSQLVKDNSEFKKVIEEAYRICYFENGIDTNPEAGPATYNDLLSYYNQYYHAKIDRFLIKDPLEKLMVCEMEARGYNTKLNYEEQYVYLCERRDKTSSTEEKFLKILYERGLKLPDEAQFSPTPDVYVRPDFYYRQERACVFCDGKPHDNTKIKEEDMMKREALRNLGYDVIEYYYLDSPEELVQRRSDIFRKVR